MTPASWVRRLAVAARPSPPWWHVTVPSWLARLLVAGGARAAASRPGGPAPEAWEAPGRQRFLIRELHDVHVVREGPDRLTVTLTVVAGTLAVTVAASWPFLHSTAAWFVAVTFVAVPAVLAALCWWWNPPRLELRATYRDRPVRLFQSRDGRVFGQVMRALIRAIEANGAVE